MNNRDPEPGKLEYRISTCFCSQMNSGLIFHPMMTHSPQDILSMMDFVDSWFDLGAENDLHDWVLAYVSLTYDYVF